MPDIPLLEEREDQKKVGSCSSPATAGSRAPSTPRSSAPGSSCERSSRARARTSSSHVVGRRGTSSCNFRGEPVESSYIGFTDRPAFANAREIGDDLTSGYIDEDYDRVDLIYNRYVSPLTQYVRRQTLLPLQQAEVFGEGIPEPEEPDDSELAEAHAKALWIYEPEPEELLPQLFQDYADLSVFRALLESTASEHGSRMTAMRNAAENAQDMIKRPDAGDEPRTAGRDHPGDLGSGRRRRGTWIGGHQGDEWLKQRQRKRQRQRQRRPRRAGQGVVVDVVFPDETCPRSTRR